MVPVTTNLSLVAKVTPLSSFCELEYGVVEELVYGIVVLTGRRRSAPFLSSQLTSRMIFALPPEPTVTAGVNARYPYAGPYVPLVTTNVPLKSNFSCE